MKRILHLITIGIMLVGMVHAQDEISYGFEQNPGDPYEFTATAYPNFTSNNVTLSTAVFSFLLPENTVTDPSIPLAPMTGSFVDVTGSWMGQKITPGLYASLSLDPNDLEGNDVYQVVLQSSPILTDVQTGVGIPLFSFRLPEDCMNGDVEVLTNNSAIQQSINQNLGANFNNQMSVSINDAPASDIYAGNHPANASYDCPLEDDDPENDPPIITYEEEAVDTIYVIVPENTTDTTCVTVMDPDGDPVECVLSGPGNGNAFLLNDTCIVYTPNSDYIGTDQVVKTACDPLGACDSVIIIYDVIPEPEVALTSPCACMNNATTLENGQFLETFTVISGPGQSWMVTSALGFYDANSPAPPASPNAIAPLTPLPETFPGSGMYELTGIFVEGQGYTVNLINELGQQLTATNNCYYPTPVIASIDGDICIGTPPISLEGNAGGAAGTGSFTINGQPATVFDPEALGVGYHTVEFTFDAGAAGLNDPDDPGCVQSIAMNVSVLETPDVVACNDQVQASFDGNCEILVLPDMILEGEFICNDDFAVAIHYNNNSVPNPVTLDYVGLELIVTVTHIPSGNNCWGILIPEDKTAPVFDCPEEPVTINCWEELDNVLPPPAYDNCTDVSIQLVDEVWIDDDICDDDFLEVHRYWIAIDDFGNESEICLQPITIYRPSDVDFPDDITWECSDYAAYPTIVEATIYTGVLSTTGSGIPGNGLLDGLYCQFGYTHSDEILETCGETFKIVRTWTVLDWCTGEVITENEAGEDNVQIIKVIDSTPPLITMESYTVNANIAGQHPQPCKSQDFLPAAEVSDNCSDWEIQIFTPVGEAIYLNGINGNDGGFIPAPGLELGFHDIQYQATDICGNVASLTVTIEVVDETAPVAICDEITEVALTSDGMAIVNADVFDDGSYDNCCLDEFLVRRMDGDCEGNYDEFDPTVKFCCVDAGQAILVVFRAVDCYDNYNDCMVTVNVEDKQPPFTTLCPGPQTIDCDFYLDNLAAAIDLGDYSVLDQFGEAEFFDNCDLNIDYEVMTTISTCTEGNITRTWTASDSAGNPPAVCSQTIFVEHVSDWVVEFPEDINAECEDGALPEFGEPQIFHDECELIGTSYEDTYFYIVPDACYKIKRVWTVINWCIYDDYGYDVWSEAGYAECNLFQDWDGDGDFDCRTFRDGWNESGTPGTPDGYIWYEQVIKVIDDEAPIFDVEDQVVCIEEADCDTDVTLPTPVVDDCAVDGIEITVSSDLPNGTADQYVYEDVPPGTYTVLYEVTDNCGNTSYDEIEVTVVDCKKPTPYCVNGLVIEIMQTGMVDVWAIDFDAGSFDNCPGDLQLSFSQDVSDIQRIYTCDDIGQQQIQLWVTDAVGNQDYCETFVNIQDNMDVCDSAPGIVAVSGTIATEEEATVEGVMVDVNSGLATQTTPVDGTFAFSLQAGGDYTVTPLLDEDADNGVTTYDMVLISRHILNVELLDSPYKIIAADANNSGAVTTLDLVAIRKVILFIEEEFPNNTSWRFVDADHSFPDALNPWSTAFNEVISYNNLLVDDLEADFVALKVGDVNNSAAANSQQGAAERSTAGTLLLQTTDRKLRKGESQVLWFDRSDPSILGYQFTLDFDPAQLSIIGFEAGVALSENFGWELIDRGALTASWHRTGQIPLQKDQWFALEVRAERNVQISEALSINSRFTKAEAYGADAQQLDVQLAFTNEGPSELALLQNTPNPFSDRTKIGFYLPENQEIQLTVFDLHGQEVAKRTGQFQAGYNAVFFDLEGAPKGVLYYRIETETEQRTKIMTRF